MPFLLDVLELAHVAAGAVVIAVVAAMWWRAGRPALLRRCPWRANHLTWAAVLFCAVVYFLFAALSQRAFSFAVSGGGDAGGLSAISLALTNIVAQLAGLVASLWVAAVSFRRGLAGLGLTLTRWSRGVAWAFLAFMAFEPLGQLLLIFSMWAIALIAPDYVIPEHPAIRFLRRPETTYAEAFLLCLGAAVVAPVAEEVFFRGILQTVLRRTLRSRSYAVAAAAVVFGGSHGLQPHAVLPLIAFGLLLGASYERTGSLLAPMLLHALFNSKSLVWEAMSW